MPPGCELNWDEFIRELKLPGRLEDRAGGRRSKSQERSPGLIADVLEALVVALC